MRVLVTGAGNAYGAAVARALAEAGHSVRAFGIPAGEDPFHDPRIETYPGTISLGGSVEPVASECQALVHCANLDPAGKDKPAHEAHVERGTLYARYGAERELVGSFLALFPANAGRGWDAVLGQAKAHVKATRPLVPHAILSVASPQDAVDQVVAALAKVQAPGLAPAPT